MNTSSPTSPSKAKATWQDYLSLTKPKVISLLLFTTIMAMFIAAKGSPSLISLIGVFIGPVVTDLIPVKNAVIFALSLTFLSFLFIALSSNILAALLSWAGIAFYVIIYTMWLKRNTWQNIVIGGAAGAIPPLVGWAAVTGELSLLAWFLFAIIFVWTPVHFWALALMIKDEYAAVGIPMAPLVIGDKATVIQIVMYAVLTVVLTIIPFFMHEFSFAYFHCNLGDSYHP